MAPPQPSQPIGLRLTRTARAVAHEFERAMTEAGGSAATWQVLLLVRSRRSGAQARMAEAMGITDATLTHHLKALESRGLVRRWREADNRRVQRTALTPAGEKLFVRLRDVARRHDRRLRARLGGDEAALLADLLAKLEDGAAEGRGRAGRRADAA